MRKIKGIWQSVRAFGRAKGANVAMMFGLSLVPLAITAGAGLDFARAMMERGAISDALDAASLAIGAKPGMSASDAQALAQNVFNANYKGQNAPTVGTPTINGQSVSLTASESMSTTLLALVGKPTLNLSVGSTVVWGQTKLWVALVLDNTGSMTQTDSTGTSKITALQNASHQLIATLQSAAANPGDVQLAIVPFAKDVKVGTANVGASWIDWSDWNTVVPGAAPASNVGPGSSCPLSLGCVDAPGSTNSISTVPSSGTYKGYICPDAVGSSTTGQNGHYYDGCYTSTATQTSTTTQTATTPTTVKQHCSQLQSGGTTTCTQTSSTTGSTTNGSNTVITNGYAGDSGPTVSSNTVNGSPSDGSKTCTGSPKTCTWTRTIINTQTTTTVTATGTSPYNHAWVVNDHSLWTGCVMDRNQNDDANDTTPGNGFPAENDQSCVVAPLITLSFDWTALGAAIDAMVANGGTNQTIGLAHGMQLQTTGAPYNAPTLPGNTTRYIILLSDGLNTMDRWYGDGSNQSTSVDAREALACSNAKAQGFIIYTVFVDLGGTQGSSTALQNCASGASNYYDLTTSNAIVTTFNQIAQKITNLRVSN
jgi:Flp pilus assembly protein TadG